MSDMYFGYCENWSDEHKAAEKKGYRLSCLLKCLEGSLSRIDPEDFDETMARIEKTREELFDAVKECERFRREE